jgi:hypothetical protein
LFIRTDFSLAALNFSLWHSAVSVSNSWMWVSLHLSYMEKYFSTSYLWSWRWMHWLSSLQWHLCFTTGTLVEDGRSPGHCDACSLPLPIKNTGPKRKLVENLPSLSILCLPHLE